MATDRDALLETTAQVAARLRIPVSRVCHAIRKAGIAPVRTYGRGVRLFDGAGIARIVAALQEAAKTPAGKGLPDISADDYEPIITLLSDVEPRKRLCTVRGRTVRIETEWGSYRYDFIPTDASHRTICGWVEHLAAKTWFTREHLFDLMQCFRDLGAESWHPVISRL